MSVERNVIAGRTDRHIAALDGIRGLAVLLVMIHHETVMLVHNSAQLTVFNILSAGWIGVELFFVLSGYLITGILLDTRGQPHYFRNFYARRILRIFPLFYLLAIFSFVILPHLPLPAIKAQRFGSVGGDQWMYWTFLVNVAVAKANLYRHGIMDVAWSLSIEEQFYLLWPLVALFCSRRTLAALCILILVSSPIIRALAWEGGLSGKQIYVLTPFRLDGLAAGALLACATRSMAADRFITPRMAVVLSSIGLLVFIATIAISGDPESENRAISIFGYSGAAFASLGLLACVLSLPAGHHVTTFFALRPMRTLGKYSYCLYLVHLPLRAAIRDMLLRPAKFEAWPGGVFVAQSVFTLVSIGAALMVAWLSWRIVERPFLSLKRCFPNVESSAPGGPYAFPRTTSPLGHTTTG